MSDEPQSDDPMIAALLRERAGLVQRDLPDRVKQVDEQLKHHGYKRSPAKAAAAKPPAQKEQTPAEKQPPTERQQPATQQT